MFYKLNIGNSPIRGITGGLAELLKVKVNARIRTINIFIYRTDSLTVKLIQ